MDRIDAMADVLASDAAPARPGPAFGPADPVCTTGRDLDARVLAVGRQMLDAGRGLAEFLHAWWAVGRTLAGHDRFEPDMVAAMFTAAATLDPPPLPPGWRSARYGQVSEPPCYAGWETIVLSQLADLADLADAGPLGAYAFFGLDVPRPAGAERATGARWFNFDPRAYLECGMAGTLGGRPGPLDPITWADLAAFAHCGQVYE